MPKRVDNNIRELALLMLAEGMSGIEVCRHTGCSRSTIFRWIKAARDADSRATAVKSTAPSKPSEPQQVAKPQQPIPQQQPEPQADCGMPMCPHLLEKGRRVNAGREDLVELQQLADKGDCQFSHSCRHRRPECQAGLLFGNSNFLRKGPPDNSRIGIYKQKYFSQNFDEIY